MRYYVHWKPGNQMMSLFLGGGTDERVQEFKTLQDLEKHLALLDENRHQIIRIIKGEEIRFTRRTQILPDLNDEKEPAPATVTFPKVAAEGQDQASS